MKYQKFIPNKSNFRYIYVSGAARFSSKGEEFLSRWPESDFFERVEYRPYTRYKTRELLDIGWGFKHSKLSCDNFDYFLIRNKSGTPKVQEAPYILLKYDAVRVLSFCWRGHGNGSVLEPTGGTDLLGGVPDKATTFSRARDSRSQEELRISKISDKEYQRQTGELQSRKKQEFIRGRVE
jgi:hypothetical protein